MAATQNELVVTPRLASSLRSMIDSSGATPSSPTRSNSRPRWARCPAGRARSSSPKAVTAMPVPTSPAATVRNRSRYPLTRAANTRIVGVKAMMPPTSEP